MAKFQYNRFLEHSGKPKKPPLLSQRMEDNRISFRIDEVKELNDKLWLMGKDTPLKTGFKIKEEDKPTFSPLIPPTWSDREFTQWTNSFELDEIRRDFIFDIGDFDTDAGLDIDLELPLWFIIFYFNESGSGQTGTQDKPDTVQTTTQIPEGTEVPLLGLTLSPIATQHTTPEFPLVYTVTLLNFDGEAEPVDYDMLVPINISSDGAIDVDYELSNIIPASAFGIEQGDFYDVAAFAIIPKGETSVDIIVTPINPGKTEPVEVTMAVMPIFAFTKDFNPIDNPEVGSPDGTSPINNLIMPEVESTQTGYLTPSLLTADYQFIPSDQDTDLPLEDKIPQSEHCPGTSQTAPYLPGKGFYLGTIETTIIASANIETYPSTTTSFTITPIDPDATQYWGLGDPVNMTVTDTDNAKVLTINVSGGTISDSHIVHRGSIPIVTSDPFTPTNLLISPSKWKDNDDNPSGNNPSGNNLSGKIDTTSAMPPYKPSLPGKNPTSLNGQKGAPNKYDFTSPPLWDYTVSFPNNAPPGAFIKPTVGAEAIKANPYNPAVIQFPDKIGVDVPAQVWNNNNSNPLQVGPLACLNYRIQVFLELYSTYPNDDPEDTTVRIPEGHEDPLQIIIRIVLLGDVRKDYSSEEMPLAVSLAGTATPDTDYTILGEGQTPISGTGVLADYRFSENVLGVYVPAGVLNAQLKEVTIQVPVAILLDEEKEGDETIEVTPLFPEQPEKGSTPLILWESYETTIAIILGQLADILYNFKVLQDGGKLEGFGQDIGSEQVDIITVDIPEVVVGGGATYTFPQDSELFVCYVYLQLSNAPLGSSITANVYNTSLPGSPTILDSILTVPAGQTRSNPVVLSQTQFSNGDVLQVAILSVGSEFPGAGMQLFLGRKYGEGEEINWERVGLTNTGNGYIAAFKNENLAMVVSEESQNLIKLNYDETSNSLSYRGGGQLYSEINNYMTRVFSRSTSLTSNYGTEYITEQTSLTSVGSLEFITRIKGIGSYVTFVAAPIASIKKAWDTPANTYLKRTYTYNSNVQESYVFGELFGGETPYQARDELITTVNKVVFYDDPILDGLYNRSTSEITVSGYVNISYSDCVSAFLALTDLEEKAKYFLFNLTYIYSDYKIRETRGNYAPTFPVNERVLEYISGNVTINGTKTIEPFLLPFADESHPVYKSVIVSTTETGQRNSHCDSSWRLTYPLIIGKNCSLYYNIEYRVVESRSGALFSGSSVATTDFVDRGIPRLVIKTENALYQISELESGIYDPGEHFFLVSNDFILTGNHVTILTNKSNNFLEDGNQYEIGFRQTINKDFSEGYYLSEKIGAYNQLKKKITTNTILYNQSWILNKSTTADEYYGFNLFDPDGLAVDVYIKTTTAGEATYAAYKGVISAHEYIEGDTLRRIDGTEKRYTSFTIAIQENMEDSYFGMFNESENLIYVSPSGDYSMSLCAYFSALHSTESIYFDLKNSSCYTVINENNNETLEIAISEQKPSNNNFSGAVLLEGQNVSVRGNNYGADWQGTLSEPSLSPPTQSVWYKWVAPSSNAVVIHTLGSPVAADYQVDTVIAVYTGSSLDSLSLVASNDNVSVELPPNGDYLSAVVINPTEGTTYYIQVDGWSNTQWSFVLSITTGGLNVPTPIQEETRRADIYRFDTQTLKWKRMPNAVSAISPLTGASDFISYHATPQTETLTDGFICPEE